MKKYGTRARFVVEDFGASPLADRFGIDKYPAVFIDDALVSRPEDFYAWGGDGKGRYIPWTEIANRRRFQKDLEKMIEIRLAGGNLPAVTASKQIAAERFLPPLTLVDLAGKSFKLEQLKGKPVLVEIWASWCPPCLYTLSWLKKMDSRKVSVVAIATESERKDVDAVVEKFQPPGRIVMGTPEAMAALDPPAIPTLFLADRNGKIVRVFYGAPPDLHEQITKELAKLN